MKSSQTKMCQRYSITLFLLQCLGLTPEELESREVDFLDIAYDEIKPHHYKEAEDPKFFKSEKTGRGPLVEGWRETHQPIMCCYKVVHVKFEVWGLQTRVEEYVQGVRNFKSIIMDYFQARDLKCNN